ncbi:MAG: ribonuclease HII [Clostridiales bacterium GWF2_38_85]|nr:MAG: ribonuclease HII [Clostridiales bacterium GWF2_38_85]HBL83617.1 ribonuclease HII [Clostridiales bacterium]
MEWNFEISLYPETDSIVCGVDEAGRGPLAGDVFAAAVILPKNYIIDGLNDSKKLSAKKRDLLFDIIKESAISFSIATASVEEIEQLNILEASLLAMRRAIDRLPVKPAFGLIDGNVTKEFTLPVRSVISGDALCPSISAASILAKVARDSYCLEMDSQYPEYGFAVHKGYGTEQHRSAILKYGVCPLHRKLFLRKIIRIDS